jgi:uncharacterized protein (DUF983 family)
MKNNPRPDDGGATLVIVVCWSVVFIALWVYGGSFLGAVLLSLCLAVPVAVIVGICLIVLESRADKVRQRNGHYQWRHPANRSYHDDSRGCV